MTRGGTSCPLFMYVLVTSSCSASYFCCTVGLSIGMIMSSLTPLALGMKLSFCRYSLKKRGDPNGICVVSRFERSGHSFLVCPLSLQHEHLFISDVFILISLSIEMYGLSFFIPSGCGVVGTGLNVVSCIVILGSSTLSNLGQFTVL